MGALCIKLTKTEGGGGSSFNYVHTHRSSQKKNGLKERARIWDFILYQKRDNISPLSMEKSLDKGKGCGTSRVRSEYEKVTRICVKNKGCVESSTGRFRVMSVLLIKSY